MAIKGKGKSKGKEKGKSGSSEIKAYPAASAILYEKDDEGNIDYKNPVKLGALWARVSPFGKIEFSGNIEGGRLEITLDGGYKSRSEALKDSDDVPEVPEVDEED